MGLQGVPRGGEVLSWVKGEGHLQLQVAAPVCGPGPAG